METCKRPRDRWSDLQQKGAPTLTRAALLGYTKDEEETAGDGWVP